MKTALTLAAQIFAGTAYAQSIPEPVAYDPVRVGIFILVVLVAVVYWKMK